MSKQENKIDSLPPPERPKWIFILKLSLFVTVLIAATIFIRLFWLDGGDDISFFSEKSKLPLPSNIVNLEIIGKDDKDRPYVLLATSVTPKEGSAFYSFFTEEGLLKDLEMMVEWGRDNWLSMQSNAGEFNHRTKRLIAGPNFNVYFGAGYQLKGKNAAIDLAKGTMIIEGDVEGWGPIGEINAAAADVERGGEYTRFYGGVEVLLFSSDEEKK